MGRTPHDGDGSFYHRGFCPVPSLAARKVFRVIEHEGSCEIFVGRTRVAGPVQMFFGRRG